MALPTFVSKGAFASGTGAPSVGAPAGAVVDLVNPDLELLFVESANQAISTPSGWTECSGSPQSTGTAAAAGGVRLAVFYRWVTATLGNITVADSGDHTTAIRHLYRGVDPYSPITVTAGSVKSSATGTTFTLTGLTTPVNDCLIVLAVANDRDATSTTNLSSWTNANLSNLTERHDQVRTAGFGGGLGTADGGKASAGAIGNTTVTNAAANTAAFLVIALNPNPHLGDASATAEASVTGELTDSAVAAALDGDAVSQSTASASLTTAIPLAGSLTDQASASAGLTTQIRPAGSASIISTASASLTTQIALSGSSMGVVSAQGLLNTQIRLEGVATGLQNASGTLTSSPAQLTGSASVSCLAEGTLSGSAAELSGSSVVTVSAGALLNTQIRLEGASTGLQNASGSLSTEIRLSATASVTVTLASDLSTAIQMAGMSACQVGFTADLTTTVALAGLLASEVLASGQLSTGIALSGQISAVASSVAELSAGRGGPNSRTMASASVEHTAASVRTDWARSHGTVPTKRGTSAGATASDTIGSASMPGRTTRQARVQ